MINMNIIISHTSSQPIYEQIISLIKQLILHGDLEVESFEHEMSYILTFPIITNNQNQIQVSTTEW